jgi:transcriptional regulator with XRE-family HTH domain
VSAVVGSLLRDAAEASGATQSKLAKLTGVSQPAISQYFNGLRPITVDVLAALCAALELDSGVVMRDAIARLP